MWGTSLQPGAKPRESEKELEPTGSRNRKRASTRQAGSGRVTEPRSKYLWGSFVKKCMPETIQNTHVKSGVDLRTFGVNVGLCTKCFCISSGTGLYIPGRPA